VRKIIDKKIDYLVKMYVTIMGVNKRGNKRKYGEYAKAKNILKYTTAMKNNNIKN